MDINNNIRMCVFGAILAVVAAEAPLLGGHYPPAIPAPVYGVPKVEVPLAPYPPAVPAPVYGPPQVAVAPAPIVQTAYKYEVLNPPPRPVEILAPYPAPAPLPIVKAAPYPPAVPAAVYGPPAIPAPVYGPPPQVVIPAPQPIHTSYNYELINPPPRPVEVLAPYPGPVPVLKTGPYPAPAPIVPHSEYGLPN